MVGTLEQTRKINDLRLDEHTGTAELGVTHATAPPHATGPAAYFLDGSGMGMYLLPPERQKPGIPDERWTNEACARTRNRSRIDAVISH